MSNQRRIDRRGFLAAGALAAAGLTAPAIAESRTAGRRLEGKRVLIATGESGEALETYYMIFRLREEGAIPVVGSRTVKRLQLVVHDFEPAYEGYTEKPGYQVDVDVAYQDVVAAFGRGILAPGGAIDRKALGAIEISRDESQDLVDRLDALLGNAWSGFVLVVVVLALFLRLRIALWVSVGMPVAMLGALAMFPAFGLTIRACAEALPRTARSSASAPRPRSSATTGHAAPSRRGLRRTTCSRAHDDSHRRAQ